MSQLTSPSQGFVLDRDSIRMLILVYEAHPNLYLTNHPDYKLKNKRLDALTTMKSTLFDNGYAVTIEEINKKIHNIRTQFFKEYAKVRKGVVSGAGTSDLYVPKIWWYDLLRFLINSDPVRKSRSNLQKELGGMESQPSGSSSTGDNRYCPSPTNIGHDMENEHSEIQDVENAAFETTVTMDELEEGLYLPPSVPLPKRRRVQRKPAAMEEDAKALLKNASNVLTVLSSSNRKTESNDFGAFSDMIAEELRKIGDKDEVRKVKRQILNCVLDAQERVQRSKVI